MDRIAHIKEEHKDINNYIHVNHSRKSATKKKEKDALKKTKTIKSPLIPLISKYRRTHISVHELLHHLHR